MVIFMLFILIKRTLISIFTLSDIYGCRTFRDLWGSSKCPTIFFSKFDSEYFSLIIFLKYLFILLLIMISCIIMTLLEKTKICRTFRAVGHLGTLQTCTFLSMNTFLSGLAPPGNILDSGVEGSTLSLYALAAPVARLSNTCSLPLFH